MAPSGSDLTLNLVYNPQGPSLPPPQVQLEQDYKRMLAEHFGVRFNQLLTITNQPIARFGSTLISKGQFRDYMALLRSAHRPENLPGVMCRSLVSVDWQGDLHDCDFNQMLGMPLRADGRRGASLHLRDLLDARPRGQPDRGRRPLLRVHRRPGLVVRRSAGRMTRSVGRARRGALPSQLTATRRACSRARRSCSAEVLYVVGGLYGNLPALLEIERMAALEDGARAHRLQRRLPLVRRRLRRDFLAVERGVRAAHGAARQRRNRDRGDDDANGCGCAYPESVPDDDVERSNRILARLRAAACAAEIDVARAAARGSPACRCTSWPRSRGRASESCTATPGRSPAGASRTTHCTPTPTRPA